MKTEQSLLLNVHEIRDFSKTQPEHIAVLLLFSADALELSHRFPHFDTMMLYPERVTVLHYDPQSKKRQPELSTEGGAIDKNGDISDWSLIVEVWDEAWERRMAKLSPEGLKNWNKMFEIHALFDVSRGLGGDFEQSFEDSLLPFWDETAGPELIFKLQDFHLRHLGSQTKSSPPTFKI